MKKPQLTRKERRKLFLMKVEAKRRTSFNRDLAANQAGVSKLSSNGGIVCRSQPTVGVTPPPTKSKFTPDSRGKWHYNPDS